MSELGTRISTPQDFSRVAVYERPGPAGTVYTVAFTNREVRPQWQIGIGLVISIGILAWFVAGFVYVPSEHAFAAIFLPCLIGVVGLLAWIGWPYRPQILIELDFGRLLFRVRKDGKVTFERPLAAFHNMTVEDHPDLQDERERRAEHRQKGAGVFEKQHALVGWFGAEGAERTDLLYRFEWPKRYSLQEVAGAVNWAIKQAAESAARGAAQRPEPVAAGRSGSIKPPLD